MQSIMNLGYTPEDVMLDMYESLPNSSKVDLVSYAVRERTANIPAVFLDHIEDVSPSYFHNTHLGQSLKLLGELTYYQRHNQYWYLARAAKVCNYVASVVNDHHTKLQGTIGPATGSNTSPSGPNLSVGESVSTNNTELSPVSN